MESLKVQMVRDAKKFPESHDANVHPDNVADFEADGWTVKKPRKSRGAEATADGELSQELAGDGEGEALPPIEPAAE